MRRGIKESAEAAMTPEACRRIRLSIKKDRPCSMRSVEDHRDCEACKGKGIVQRGLTQDEFAAELGVQPLTIYFWETGKTPISKGRAMSIQALVVRGVV